MAALSVLIAAAALLLALGATARIMPRRVALLQALVCLAGVGAALVACLFAPGVAVMQAGATFAADGLTGVALVALFLLGACGAAGPVAIGGAALAMLAGDAVTLVVATAGASLTIPAWRPKAMALGGLTLAVALLAWHGLIPDPRFTTMRELPPGAIADGLALLGVLIATVALPAAMPAIPGALLSFTLLARLLLDLAGPITPGWWGAPVLLLGSAGAVLMARRGAAAADLAVAIASSIQAMLALAVCGIGAALLARGADLAPLAALSLTAALLLVLTVGLWGGLALLAAGSIQAAAGTTALARLGGLLRRVPVTGLALLIALLSPAAIPLSAGFAAFWTLLQALFSAARLGGIAVLALSAGAVACVGLTAALLAATALRMLGASLLGAPRSAKAAAAAEPGLAVRVGMGVLACATIAAGLVPSLLVQIAQPAIRQLTGGAAEGATLFGLSTTADAPGYAAPAIAGLLAGCTGLAAWAGRGQAGEGGVLAAPVWRGGLSEDGPARLNTMPLLLWPGWRAWRPAWSPRFILAGLALALAAALGWAAR